MKTNPDCTNIWRVFLLLGVLSLLSCPLAAQSEVDDPVVREDSEDGAEGDAKPRLTVNLLGHFLEVRVLTSRLVELEGWIREKARVEIFMKKQNRYVQLADTPENKAIEGAGIRLYFVDGMHGFMFLEHSDITEVTKVREISLEEEEEWQAELERQLQERREALKRIAEERKKKEDEAAAAAAEEEGEGEGEGDFWEDLSPELRKGYRLLEDYPAPEWGEVKYNQLRRLYYVERLPISIEQRRFIENYKDYWLPAFEHQQANQ